MERRPLVAGGIVLVVAFGVMARPYFVDRGVVTAVPIDEALDRFRELVTTVPTATAGADAPATSTPASTPTPTSASASASASPTPVAVLPEPGVYVYTTTGGDSVDALNGDHHDYPSTTTITVRPSGCGVVQRWDVAVERWQEWERCAVGDAVAQPARTNFDQFFGTSQTDAYECAGDPRPVSAPPGTTWSFTCTEDGEAEVVLGTVVGVETKAVAGESVDTLHVRLEIAPVAEGDSQVTDSWYLVGSDLLVAQSELNATTESTAIGAVHYAEQYLIELTSLVPLS